MGYLITKDDGSKYPIHYGIQGQKWGIRNFQNEDGSLTPEGRERYRNMSRGDKKIFKAVKKFNKYNEGLYKKTNIDPKKNISGFFERYDDGVYRLHGKESIQKKFSEAAQGEMYNKDVKASLQLDDFMRELSDNPNGEAAKHIRKVYKDAMNEARKKSAKDITTLGLTGALTGVGTAVFASLGDIPFAALGGLESAALLTLAAAAPSLNKQTSFGSAVREKIDKKYDPDDEDWKYWK